VTPDPHIRLAVAALAMQALITKIPMGAPYSARDVASDAAALADALLAELARGKR
jgi:hypothetical protein